MTIIAHYNGSDKTIVSSFMLFLPAVAVLLLLGCKSKEIVDERLPLSERSTIVAAGVAAVGPGPFAIPIQVDAVRHDLVVSFELDADSESGEGAASMPAWLSPQQRISAPTAEQAWPERRSLTPDVIEVTRNVEGQMLVPAAGEYFVRVTIREGDEVHSELQRIDVGTEGTFDIELVELPAAHSVSLIWHPSAGGGAELMLPVPEPNPGVFIANLKGHPDHFEVRIIPSP